MERRKVCRYFEKGSCKKANCPFVHMSQNRKNCEFFMKGFCRKGNNCNFYHPPKEVVDKIHEQKVEKPKYKQQVYKDDSEEEDLHQTMPAQNNQQHLAHEHQEKREQLIKKEEIGEQQPYPEESSKIDRINFLLGIDDSSESSDQSQQIQPEQSKKQQLQFFKIYPWKFPDLSKTPEFKQRIAHSETKYFKDGFMNMMNKLQDPAQKQHYQIIRKFQDSFQQSEESPRLYTISIRPLLYDQQMNFYFPFSDETVDIKVDCSKYPQQKAEIRFLNQSFPIEYIKDFEEHLRKVHEKKNLFQTLKYLQNNFQAMYQKTKFKLENQFFSKRQVQKKVKKQQKKVMVTEAEIQARNDRRKEKQMRKKFRQQEQNRQAIVSEYKDGQKIDVSSVNYEITVQSTLVQNAQYLLIGRILLYVECYCENQIMHVLEASEKKDLKVGVKLKCRKCQNNVIVCLVREIMQIRSNFLGKVGVQNGRLLDIGGIAWRVGCTCDNQVRQTKILLPGVRANVNCHHCFQSMVIMYAGIKFFNPFLKEFQIQNDKQLPNKGGCKHLKLSFRHFRYGCCGRLFPCDECHDLGSIRRHQKLEGITMLCGYCSHEQPVQKECAKCKKELVKGVDKTGHWQGGLGCRDQGQISKKDNKKYTGLTKKKQKQK